MLFIIEGPDGSGKSTLIKKLRESLPQYAAFISTTSRPSDLGDILGYMDWTTYPRRDLIIFCDRYPLISEMIYGPILRGTSLIKGTVKDFEKYLRFQSAYIINCRPPSKQIKKNIKKNDQRGGVVECIDGIIKRYDDLMADISDETGIPILHHDYTSEKYCLTPQQIDSFIRTGELK